MKAWIIRISLLLIMLLAACTPRIYGVPQERWETMSEQERISAMEAYKARQEALRQKRAEQARIRAMERKAQLAREAMEKEAQLAREAEEARQRQLQIDAIYRGEGLYGDLLRVTLEGGMLEIHGHHQPFHPVAFKIAASEVKDIEIVSRRGQRVRLTAQYDGSNLLLDETPHSHRSTALHLPYEDAWEDGAAYTGRSTKGPLELKGVDITVRIVGRRPVDHRRRRHKPRVVVVQRPVEKPRHPEVIVVQPPAQKPRHPKVIGAETPRHEQKHEMVAAAPQALAGLTAKHVEHRPPGRIKVVFRKGRLIVKKHSYPLAPQTVYLRDGQTRSVIMRGSNRNLKVRLGYIGGELLIDDSAGKGPKGTRLGFVPQWKSGQPYAIKSTGNRALEDLDVLIQSQ